MYSEIQDGCNVGYISTYMKYNVIILQYKQHFMRKQVCLLTSEKMYKTIKFSACKI